MKRIAFFVLTMALTVCCAAQGATNDVLRIIVGTWVFNERGAIAGDMTIVFNENGTGTVYNDSDSEPFSFEISTDGTLAITNMSRYSGYVETVTFAIYFSLDGRRMVFEDDGDFLVLTKK